MDAIGSQPRVQTNYPYYKFILNWGVLILAMVLDGLFSAVGGDFRKLGGGDLAKRQCFFIGWLRFFFIKIYNSTT
ncbi:hypothetical protein [Geitlerinema sp. PCC 9228]|uniref:hypothetical protein n=1 Tax=Geitlerinema sp. PCC 9228 TaxID=111611 RepID=UPI001114F656|nr:hypothetical protein [Geitlerinema sp. PCC 9228]